MVGFLSHHMLRCSSLDNAKRESAMFEDIKCVN